MSSLLNPVTYYRASRWLYLRRVPLLPRCLKVFSELLFHFDVPYTAKIGAGFQVAHRGFGIVVHPRVEMGRNVVLSPCVTIGGRSGKYGVPRIGDDVFIASGARVLGDVTIGDGAVLGANAVVIRSVPARSVVAGVPARVVRENIDTYEYTGWAQPARPKRPLEPRHEAGDAQLAKPTRVLLFVHSLEMGGSEKQCVEMARLLSGKGFAVTVGCLRARGALRSAVEEANLPLVEFPVRSVASARGLWQMARLAWFLRRHRFQVVHTNDLYSNLFAIPAALLARVPVTVSCQRDLSHWWWYTPPRRRILRAIQKKATWVLVNSEAIRQDLIDRDGVDPWRIRVVYNGVDAPAFSLRPSRREELLPQVPADCKLVIMVGNMHIAVKGHQDLIAAAKIVSREAPEVRFLLVGDGEMRSVFEEQVRAAGLEKAILFLGSRTDVPALLSCCDLGVLASRVEGLPNAVLEYMAAGLPTVATRVGGIPEIIRDHVSGLLVRPNDPPALAAAILRVLQDDDLRKRLATAGRERVLAKFDFGRVAEGLLRLYQGPAAALKLPGATRQPASLQHQGQGGAWTQR
jgi:glycosyltransferase involved in cell wall biosynthesis/serine acetyltransferase